MLRSLFIAVTLLGAAVSSGAHQSDSFDAHIVADSLTRKLHHTMMSADSLEILNDLFDLVPVEQRDSIGMMAYRVALRMGNSRAGLDIVRNLDNLNLRSDSLLHRNLELAMAFPPSDDRDQTVAFTRAYLPYCFVQQASPQQIDSEIQRLTRLLNTSKDLDTYDRIVINHTLAVYVSTFSQGDMLAKYIDRLGELIEQLPPDAYVLRNHYYVQGAIIYTNNGELAKAVELDRKLLRAIDDLEKGRVGFNRAYRNYDQNRYVCYARMLTNYEALAPGEFEQIYAKAMNIAQSNARVRLTMERSQRPQIAFAMHNKDYRQALALLRQYIDAPSNAFVRPQLLQMMLEAADAVGDTEASLAALRDINQELQQHLDEHTREKVKELELAYDLNRLRQDTARKEIRLQRTLLIVSLSACLLLLVLLGFFLRQLWRSRRLTHELRATNQRLKEESQVLLSTQEELLAARDHAEGATRVKNDFIRNMRNEIAVPVNAINEYISLIIDCSEAQLKPYLSQYARLVQLKGEMLTTLVNDVISLSEIDASQLSVEPSKSQLRPLCELAVKAVSPHANAGVSMEVKPGLRDLTVDTDPHRLLQILNQLLLNAAKFTTNGTITLGYNTTTDGKSVEIWVTDTGEGIPHSEAEAIFERFTKLDRTMPGMGIGLTVARHIATLLGGTLRLDTAYTGTGARFVLTIPR